VGEAHLAMLQKTLALLERYAREVKRGDLDADWETWVKVRAALELAAQCAIDAALDLISKRGLGAPQTYRDAFAVLATAGLIDATLLAELQAWAGMRNVLVHMYTKLDLDRVYAALKLTAPLRTFQALMAKAALQG
jgi:uncharacterized protein YutE (UPF0331/DUF86 family)